MNSETNHPQPSSVIPVIPESAPFTPAQRAWLNGFFAGLLGLDGLTPPAAAAVQAGTAGAAGGVSPLTSPETPALEETFPWHDPTLKMEERLKLAEGKPQERVLMAAMAQLDCGACGYVCKTYSEAISSGEEKELTRCVPGGKETARKIKEILERGRASGNGGGGGGGGPAGILQTTKPAGTNGVPRPSDVGPNPYSRKNPYPATLLQDLPLNGKGSNKDTRHLVFDLNGSGLSYEVGDSLGIYPSNCGDLVQAILERIGAKGDEKVPAPDGSETSLRKALAQHYDLHKISDKLLSLLEGRASCSSAEAVKLENRIKGEAAELPDDLELLDLLELVPSARPEAGEFVGCLSRLQPRLYSIASSPKAHPGEVHLTVSVLRFQQRGRMRKGVASTFLAERAQPGERVPVFVQPSHKFRLPASDDTPIIMVGPGTGIAPFRAFLEERGATGSKGRNWLFFGDQHRDTDFLYQAELERYLQGGLLARLDTAFSRDQDQKVYVQHRMMENAEAIWKWLNDGAHFYVCGDAKRMARDVDHAFQKIVEEQGRQTEAQARATVADIARANRYQKDVY